MKDSLLKKIWKDPVGSKVIAYGLIFVLSQIAIFIWGLIKSLDFFQVYSQIFKFFQSPLSIKDWLVILLFTALVIIIIVMIQKQKRVKPETENNPESETTETEKEIETEIREAPTVFFHHRFCDAFPGFNAGYREFRSKRDIINRLKILLASPLTFDKGDGYGIDSTPIWWFRGSSAMHIKRFEVLKRRRILLDYDELIIDKVIAHRGHSYYQDFVYLECKADKATGLYEHNQLTLENFFNEGKEYKEEYGILKNRFISRQDYDDGSTILNGKPVKTIGAELRSRTLIKYNFIICAKFAPYNCDEFSRNSKEYFRQLLKKQITFDEFAQWMNEFPKSRLDR